ncbi:MAG: hypothetical protein ABFQ65_00095 [Nanoarchaeota archaeon]
MKKGVKGFLKKPKAMKFDAFRLGLAGGIISAICISLSTIAGMLGYFSTYNSMTTEIYGMFGYSTSWLGVFLGATYGFFDGFFMVWIFALIYNRLIR